ncbi:CHASE2 domain-containing protein [uncultured Halovibrio sp.]|mgnify:CR=1 FL=1|uniref:CHASE2 domain-containing protein n=1 Tax=uncultured Halovibrio sp. TaxID=985049 RepID=UPI0025FC5097|nr:CHASE2 domain-containing protein [uncultured Halovibrio sp.]
MNHEPEGIFRIMETAELLPSRRLARWHLALPLLAVLVLLLSTSTTQRLDFWLHDTFIRLMPVTPPDDLAIVAIDEKSLGALGRWPWPRHRHASLINRLDEAGAGPIALDILFTEPSQNGHDDRLLAEAMERHGNVILPLHIFPGDSETPLREFLPTARLTRAATALGHVHAELDDDGIARTLFRRQGLGEATWPSLADAVAMQAGIQRRAPAATEQAAPYVNVRSHRVHVPFTRTGAIPRFSYIDVLKGRVPDSRLAGRTLFVGHTAAGFGDVLPTPLSGRGNPLTGVEFHANTYAAMARDRLIHPGSLWPVAATGIAIILLITLAFPRMRPTRTLLLSLGLTALPLLLSALAMRWLQLWMPPAAPAVVAALAFPLWTAERLALLTHFLNRQLDALGHERDVPTSELADTAPARLLEHLEELLGARDGWLVTEGQAVRGQPPVTTHQFQQPGKWQHEATTSRVRFHRNGAWHELGLVWPTSGTDDARRAYLNRLPLHAGTASAAIKTSRERLSRRIQRVHSAALNLAGMRRFIGTGFERMPDGVIVTDALGVIEFVNGHIAAWFGTPRESLQGMPLARLLAGSVPYTTPPPGTRNWRDAVLSVLTGGTPLTAELPLGQQTLLFHLTPFGRSPWRQPGLIANFSDITDLRERQRQYREAIDFISHDMRSPLVSQLALLDQLQRENRHADPETLGQIARLARRSYELAEEFVQLARAEDLTEKRFYECELLTIAENAVDAVQQQARSRGIRIELEGEEDLWLQGNAELLERAVINLLTNALQYSPESTEVAVTVEKAGGYGIVAVADQGPGIAPEDQPLVFQRFRRQQDQEMGGPHGAGLGLAFVQTVAERHGGTVDLVSTLGRGATFRLYLPLVD